MGILANTMKDMTNLIPKNYQACSETVLQDPGISPANQVHLIERKTASIINKSKIS